MEQNIIEVDDKDVITIVIDFDPIPMIILKTQKGYIMNDYLDIHTANKLHHVAGKITKVTTISQALNASVIALSESAIKKGIEPGIKVRKFFNML